MEHISRLPGLGEVLAGGRFVISQRVKRSPCSSIGLSSSITPPLCIAPLIRPATATNTLNLVVVVGEGGGVEMSHASRTRRGSSRSYGPSGTSQPHGGHSRWSEEESWM